MNKLLAIMLIGIASIDAFSQTNWKIQDDYSITFKTSSAEGHFRGLDGEIVFDKANLEKSSFKVSLDVSTISTGNKTKDKHARNDSWFDAAIFPSIFFTSENIGKEGEKYVATGVIDMHGVQKAVEIPFSIDEANNRITFVGAFTINRKDYGISGPFMAFMVGEEVQVNVSVPVAQ